MIAAPGGSGRTPVGAGGIRRSLALRLGEGLKRVALAFSGAAGEPSHKLGKPYPNDPFIFRSPRALRAGMGTAKVNRTRRIVYIWCTVRSMPDGQAEGKAAATAFEINGSYAPERVVPII